MRPSTSMILTLTLITGAVAQDLKTNTIGTDIGALALGGFALEYKKLINDGKNEIGVGGATFPMSDDATWNGGWAWYRIYKNGNGEGLFYTVGCGAGPVSWDYTPDGELLNSAKYFMNGSWVDGHKIHYMEAPDAKVVFK